MARLQKKKPATASGKTKKREKTSGATASPGNEGASAPATQQNKTNVKSRIASKVTAAPAGRENFVQKGLLFFREVRSELKKVTWPTRKQAAGSTVVVIVLVFIISAFLGVVDFGLSKLVQIVLA
ncbi:MAG: preprotein translocase subunit SecE [Desulfobacteraceae bacterium]